MNLSLIIAAIVKQVAELPDRNSPEGQPEMMLVSQAELAQILEENLRDTYLIDVDWSWDFSEDAQ